MPWGPGPRLVAYNLWLATADVAVATGHRHGATGPGRAGARAGRGRDRQVSCNLVDPFAFGPGRGLRRRVAAWPEQAGTGVARAELVGLAPAAVVEAVAPARRDVLDLDPERTVEARLARLRHPLRVPARRARARLRRSRSRGRRRGAAAHGRGPGAGAAARARRVLPRSRTSRRWPARTRGSPRARHSPGRLPWPPAWTRHAPGRRGRDRPPCSWPSTASRGPGGRTTVKRRPPVRLPSPSKWHLCNYSCVNYSCVIILDPPGGCKGQYRNR